MYSISDNCVRDGNSYSPHCASQNHYKQKVIIIKKFRETLETDERGLDCAAIVPRAATSRSVPQLRHSGSLPVEIGHALTRIDYSSPKVQTLFLLSTA